MRTILMLPAAAGWIASHPGALGAADLPASSLKGAAWLSSQQNPDGGYGPFGDKEGVRAGRLQLRALPWIECHDVRCQN